MAGMSGTLPPGYTSDAQGRMIPRPRDAYNDPVTGSPNDNPLAGVDPSQQYGAAAGMASQKEAEQAAAALQAQKFGEGQQAQTSLLQNIPMLLGAAGGSGSTAPVTYGAGTGPMPNPAMLQASQEAAFARAKDQTGLIGKSAISGLRDSMAARGTLGSGIEGEETARVLNTGATQLGDVNRQQLEDTLTGATHAADVQYQGGIAQRGQNQQAVQSLMNLYAQAGRAY